MNQRHRPLQEIPHAGVVPGLTYSLDRIAGPVFARRVLAPDAARDGGGGGGSPKGVPLPGLQAARQSLGLSQAELADRSGVSEKTISRIERGGRAHYVTLDRLRKVLRVSRQQLLRPPPQVHRATEHRSVTAAPNGTAPSAPLLDRKNPPQATPFQWQW